MSRPTGASRAARTAGAQQPERSKVSGRCLSRYALTRGSAHTRAACAASAGYLSRSVWYVSGWNASPMSQKVTSERSAHVSCAHVNSDSLTCNAVNTRGRKSRRGQQQELHSTLPGRPPGSRTGRRSRRRTCRASPATP